MSEVERIKQVRQVLNHSQASFSQALGIQQGSYSDIERGKIGISSAVLKSLITTFRVNPLWLYVGKGEMFFEEEQISENPLTNNQNKGASVAVSDSVDSSKEQDFPLGILLKNQKNHIKNIKELIDFLNEEY